MKKLLNHSICIWLPVAAAIAGIFATLYFISMHNIRNSVSDISVQLATDAREDLANGKEATTIIGEMKNIDMQKSLSPFVIVYDGDRNVLAGSTKLNGKIPVPPTGVFEYAARMGEHRITWEPQQGVRADIVLMHLAANGKSTYVLAGRSLQAIERQTSATRFVLGICMLVTMAVSFIATVAGQSIKPVSGIG
jgi:hypothetical protein